MPLDFPIHRLRSDVLEVSVVPSLGARVVSLRNRLTGREWLWHAGTQPRHFANVLGDPFELSPLVGWDECLPTIGTCVCQGRALADHGEVWSAAWSVDPAAASETELRTRLRLPVSPLAFERTLRLAGPTLVAEYGLQNLSTQPEPFLWAMHPLLRVEPGDALELTGEMRQQLGHSPWLETLEFPKDQRACAKVFAGPLHLGQAGVRNHHTGDALRFEWSTAQLPLLGLWLTRGGWRDHHHLALEPTNGNTDSLAELVATDQADHLEPGETRRWSVTLSVQPASSPTP